VDLGDGPVNHIQQERLHLLLQSSQASVSRLDRQSAQISFETVDVWKISVLGAHTQAIKPAAHYPWTPTKAAVQRKCVVQQF
jgi:hypothetical protein